MKRDLDNAIIGGVCAGLAKQINMDISLVRILFVTAFLLWGIGPLIYIIMWILVPSEGTEI